MWVCHYTLVRNQMGQKEEKVRGFQILVSPVTISASPSSLAHRSLSLLVSQDTGEQAPVTSEGVRDCCGGEGDSRF